MIANPRIIARIDIKGSRVVRPIFEEEKTNFLGVMSQTGVILADY